MAGGGSTYSISKDLTSVVGGPLTGNLSQMRFYSYITGYKFTSQYSPNIYGIFVSSSSINSTNYYVSAGVPFSCTYSMTMDRIKITILIFNVTRIRQLQQSDLTYGIQHFSDEAYYFITSYNLSKNDFFYGIS
jgi:hypothetical protein